MKWKDVKVLCVGMCVCTVIAALNSVKETERDNQTLEVTEILLNEELSIIEGTENEEKAKAVHYQVEEAGNSI